MLEGWRLMNAQCACALLPYFLFYTQVAGNPGIKYVSLYVGREMSGPIGEFYKRMFDTPVMYFSPSRHNPACQTPVALEKTSQEAVSGRLRLWSHACFETPLCEAQQFKQENNSLTHRAKSIVTAGAGAYLVFVELHDEDVARAHFEAMMNAQKGTHVAVYITRFTPTYDLFYAQGLVWTNPRFIHIDTCNSREEAIRFNQFRFRSIPTVAGVYELEHETRSTCHPSFLRLIAYSRQ
jgi:hypothetical protein